MQYSSLIISLQKFPVQPFSIEKRQQIGISPRTKTILKEVNIGLQEILPLSMIQFIRINKLQGSSHQYIREIYQLEESRRIRKIEILQQIWKKQAQREIRKHLQGSQKNRKSKSLKKAINNPIKSVYLHIPKSLSYSRYHGKSASLLNRCLKDSRTSQKSRKSTKICNKKWQDYYFTKNSGKRSFQQQSTKSRKRQRVLHNKQTKKLQHRPEYFELSSGQKMTKNQRLKGKKRSSLNKILHSSKQNNEAMHIYQQICGIITKWDQLDQKHQFQNVKMQGISCIQRKRLQKLQKIERQYFRQEVQDFKNVIRSNTNKS